MWSSFSIESLCVPNYIKIRRGHVNFMLIWHGMTQMLQHSHSMQACEKRRCNSDVTIGPMCPIMSSIFQYSNVSQPLKENTYLLRMFWCIVQEDKNIGVISCNTLYFLQLQIGVHIEQSVCQHPNYSDAQPGHHLSDIG